MGTVLNNKDEEIRLLKRQIELYKSTVTQKSVMGIIKCFNDAHPDWACKPEGIGSLAKRIVNQLVKTK